MTGLLFLLVLLLRTSSTRYVRILDDANLVFHEVGHPVFAPFGRTVGFLGGTLGQLAVPFLAALVFWRRREPVSTAITLCWFFENFFSIARYMADARSLMLPLFGDLHDWNILFAEWGVLRQNLEIASAMRSTGGFGLAATWAWVVWRWWMDRRRVAASRRRAAASHAGTSRMGPQSPAETSQLAPRRPAGCQRP